MPQWMRMILERVSRSRNSITSRCGAGCSEIRSNASVDREAFFASMAAMAFGLDFKPVQLDTIEML